MAAPAGGLNRPLRYLADSRGEKKTHARRMLLLSFIERHAIPLQRYAIER
jgi:hypothetical protein